VPAPPSAGLRERIDSLPSWVGGLAGTMLIGVAWWVASAVLFQSSGSVPSPFAVLGLFFSAEEWRNTVAIGTGTLSSAGLGYLWGNLAALALAVAVLLLPALEQVATQIAIVTYCVPLVAVGPILVIVAGRDAPQAASVALAALSVFFTSVVGALLGLRAAPRASLDLVRAYGGGRWTELRLVQLVAALPNLFAALKIAAPAAFLGAVLAEYLGSGGDASIGRALIAASSVGDGPRLWYLALVCGALSGAGYLLVGLVARLVTPWSSGQPGSRS
jgi:ABC-type nitrate/sulfonate/bicarbonate transport system permease component